MYSEVYSRGVTLNQVQRLGEEKNGLSGQARVVILLKVSFQNEVLGFVEVVLASHAIVDFHKRVMSIATED